MPLFVIQFQCVEACKSRSCKIECSTSVVSTQGDLMAVLLTNGMDKAIVVPF